MRFTDTINQLAAPFLLIDQECLPESAYLVPFALTDVLLNVANEQQQPFIHFWQLEHAMILGMKDTRVPFLTDGLAALDTYDYQAVIRNAGGLGVIADAGVLNVSLILPKAQDVPLSIDTAYTFMWEWLQASFPDEVIEAYEISNSYCPGTYDLSIAGKKFAGIAQRRVKNGIAVMIYLSINGSQATRGQAVRAFYQASLKEDFGLNGYPPVEPSVMANLEDLLGQSLTVASVKQQLLQTLQQSFGGLIEPATQTELQKEAWFDEALTQQLHKMQQRNSLLKGGQ